MTADNKVLFKLSGGLSGYVCIGFTRQGGIAHTNMDSYCGVSNDVKGMTFRDGFSGLLLGVDADQANNMQAVSVYVEQGRTVFSFIRRLATGDANDVTLSGQGQQTCFYAVSSSSDLSSRHQLREHVGNFSCSFESNVPIASMVDMIDCNRADSCGLDMGCETVDGLSSCPPVPVVSSNTILYALVGFLLLILLVYLLARLYVGRQRDDERRKGLPPFKVEFFLVLRSLMTVFDFTTDCLFVRERYHDPNMSKVLVFASVVSIALPFLLNLVYISKLLKGSDMLDFWDFFKKHTGGCTVMLLLCATNTSLLRLLCSGLLGLSLFRAPIPEKVIFDAMAGSLITHVLEDAPQLTMQVLTVIASGSEASATTWSSIISSSFSLLLGLTRGWFLLLMNRSTEKINKAEAVANQMNAGKLELDVTRRVSEYAVNRESTAMTE